jgi:uncharacterized oxidoreductase
MLSIILDPSYFRTDAAFAAEVSRFIDWVKSSAKIEKDGEILMPGEIEQRARSQRLSTGIDVPETTWMQIVKTAHSIGMEIT